MAAGLQAWPSARVHLHRMLPGLTTERIFETVDVQGGRECMERLAAMDAGLDAAGRTVPLSQAVQPDRLLKGPGLATAAGVLGGILAYGGRAGRRDLLAAVGPGDRARIRSASGTGAGDFMLHTGELAAPSFTDRVYTAALQLRFGVTRMPGTSTGLCQLV